jgi:hypothetical protein
MPNDHEPQTWAVTARMRWVPWPNDRNAADLFIGSIFAGRLEGYFGDNLKPWASWSVLPHHIQSYFGPFPTKEEAKAALVAHVMKELEG